MNMDCRWVENHLEAIFCDTLAEEETRIAREHIENCAACRNEVQSLMAIDPLIKKYFHAQIARAMRAGDAPARGIRRFRWSLQTVAVAVVAVVLVLLFRIPQTNDVQTPVPAQTAAAPVSVDGPSIDKKDSAEPNERAKPSADRLAEADVASRSAVLPPTSDTTNAPAFLVSDPAGYSHSIQDYRGFKTLIGVWSPEQPRSITGCERLYKAFGSDPALRFIGVSPQRSPKPRNTTFPVFSNQGSRLMDAKPGEFVLLSESGTVTMRGLLAEDFETLSKKLRERN
jgi:hypothetical protein